MLFVYMQYSFQCCKNKHSEIFYNLLHICKSQIPIQFTYIFLLFTWMKTYANHKVQLLLTRTEHKWTSTDELTNNSEIKVTPIIHNYNYHNQPGTHHSTNNSLRNYLHIAVMHKLVAMGAVWPRFNQSNQSHHMFFILQVLPHTA